MLRKLAIQVVCLSVLACIVPAAGAQTFKYVGAGSSAMWQNFALAGYNSGSCPTGGTAPCKHFTAKSFQLTDSRNSGISAETGNVWIVWDSAATANVWLYINVDSVVGLRCYFASPRCKVVSPVAGFPTTGANLITLGGTVWGGASADTAPVPAAIVTAINAGVSVTAGMTDIRPEDGLYAECRANSALSSSGRKGLGYNSANPEGECPVLASPVANKIGSKITVNSAIGSNFAQVIAFNISGKDPFSGNTVVAGTTVPVGAAPILFITRRTSNLKSVLTATDTQLQTMYTSFSVAGGSCDGGSIGGTAGGVWCYQREPLSGTMNTTEFNVFRNNGFQTLYSQEDGVNPATDNPLCKAAGTGNKCRVIGTGQMVAQVKASTAVSGRTNFADAIGYTFFSFGNVSSIANNANYGYLKLDGVDPIGLPTTSPAQELPGAPVAGTTCTTLPCTEAQLWGAGKFSFPGVRACTLAGNSSTGYRAWSVLRLISDGTNLTNAQVLVNGAQAAAVSQVPDFIPAKSTTSGGITDAGLSCYRSHYLLSLTNTDGTTISVAGNNGLVGVEAGRDEGGCIYKKPVSGAGTLNMGQEYAPLGVPKACAAPVFP